MGMPQYTSEYLLVGIPMYMCGIMQILDVEELLCLMS